MLKWVDSADSVVLVACILCFCLNWTKIILHSCLATDVLYVQELKRGVSPRYDTGKLCHLL